MPKNIYIRLFLLLLFFSQQAYSQCVTKNSAFADGEKITYDVYYNWGFIWLHAGEADFTVKKQKYRKKTAYYLQSTGRSLKKYDWIFKVRDYFDAYIDSANLQPLYFSRKTSEGSNQVNNHYRFDYKKKKIFTKTESSEKEFKNDTLVLQACTFDVLSAIYYARNIDFEKYKINSKIPLTLLIDNKISKVNILYLGKEKITTRNKKTYNCIKFRPDLVAGTIFKSGNHMTVWVTNDANKVPVLIEAEIMVGTVKAILKKTSSLRN